VTRRERLEQMIRDVLAPLLAVDGYGVELVRFDGSVVTLRLSQSLYGDPGSARVKRQVIEPAVRTAAGTDVEIVYERAVVV